jgi:hypothetical protein
MVAEGGIAVSHTTIMRWVLNYAPEYECCWARFARPVNSSWRMDETAVSVRDGGCYLYRAVDRQRVAWPSKINLDGSAASHQALKLLQLKDPCWRAVTVRQHCCGLSISG